MREEEGDNNSRVEGQDRGRLGQTIGVGRNGGQGEDTWSGQHGYRRKLSGGKFEIWKEEGLGFGLTRVEKIMVLDLNPDPGIKTVIQVFHRQGNSSMCVPSLGWTLNRRPVCQHLLVDVKDPMVSFVKSRPAIAGTINKFQNCCPNLQRALHQRHSRTLSQ